MFCSFGSAVIVIDYRNIIAANALHSCNKAFYIQGHCLFKSVAIAQKMRRRSSRSCTTSVDIFANKTCDEVEREARTATKCLQNVVVLLLSDVIEWRIALTAPRRGARARTTPLNADAAWWLRWTMSSTYCCRRLPAITRRHHTGLTSTHLYVFRLRYFTCSQNTNTINMIHARRFYFSISSASILRNVCAVCSKLTDSVTLRTLCFHQYSTESLRSVQNFI